jgi:DNA-binding NtrC family response regulator
MAQLLLVEDDESFRLLFSKILVNLGYGLSVAHDGLAGQALLNSSKFDAVISDIRMPNLSGIDLLKWFRERDKETPFILMRNFGKLGI